MNEIVKKEYTEEEKLRAAYVLNMCTVSVSQIVDYNDEYILEQEYEAILNNLNLEQMPKDEALLNILKELLDTITFFRIYEKKKNMIEKKYQHRVKNAIWNAVPNFGLLIAGGNPISMAISLASNIGIGYMNYRRTRADLALEHENEMLELQITAIEQLNALKRELFTTSWRLADEYNFSDKYRLTERQIKQYNEILMDSDPIRRYKRLDSIKDNFFAYPAFWYFIGSAANQISRLDGEEFTEEFRTHYRKIASEHFDYFFRMNESSVLREDQLVSSCALEYFELLPNSDTFFRKELLEKAIKWSGMRPDILQICAIGYVCLKNYSEAEKLLGILVNENYNAEINAQILSAIYAFHCFEQPSDKLLFEYSLLEKQQNAVALFPLPIRDDEGKTELQLWDTFIQRQKRTVQESYYSAIKNFFAKYAVAVNGLLMRFDVTVKYPVSFFQEDGKIKREEEAERIFGNELRRLDYVEILKNRNYSTELVNILNEMLIGLQKLPFISMDEPVVLLRDSLSKVTDVFESIQEHISSGEITIENYRTLFEKVEFSSISGELQENVQEQIKEHLKSINDMKGIILAESALQRFCEKNDISLLPEEIDDYEDNPQLDPYRLDPALVGKTALSLDREEQYKKKMLEKLQSDLPGAIKNADRIGVWFLGSEEFDAYFSSLIATPKDKELLHNQAIAILDDKRFLGDTDLVFTFNSIIPIKMKMRQMPAKYKNIQWNQEEEALDIGGILFNNPNVFVKRVGIIAQDLATLRAEYDN
ncbi:MAG: hypothetical protein IKG39_11965 [Lachnospiraceae bacterium]|nr:hypothetical protein [Lachnospiraceae bacterium]